MTRASTKEDCERLMSSVLPVAEQILGQQRVLRPFGSTLSAADQLTQLGGFGSDADVDALQLLAEFKNSFRDGARRGELKASALLYSSQSEPGNEQGAVRVQLDHRDDYSVVVSFPYHFTEGGELVVEEPSAAEGPHDIFQDAPGTPGVQGSSAG